MAKAEANWRSWSAVAFARSTSGFNHSPFGARFAIFADRFSLDVGQHFFELRGAAAAQKLVHHHFGGGDDASGLLHALESEAPVPVGAGGNGIGGDVDHVAVFEGSERGLRDADVALHAAEEDSGFVAGQVAESIAEFLASEAAELHFVDGLGGFQQFGNLGHDWAEAACVLGGEEHGNFEDGGEADEYPRISQEVFAGGDRRQELLLNVDYDKGALVCIEAATGDRFSGQSSQFGKGRWIHRKLL